MKATLIACVFGLWMCGCVTSKNSLAVDASRPVYFGKIPKSLSTTEGTSVEFVEPIVASTSHVSTKERVVTGKNVSFYLPGTEETRGNIVFHVERAFQDDQEKFIGDIFIKVKVEAYVPWYTYVWDFLISMIVGKTESSGPGDVTQETMEFEGKIYTLKKSKP